MQLENVHIPPRAELPQPASEDFVPIPTAPEELAFVPKAQRKTTTIIDPNLGDEIVVVGQRQKKRKRDKPVAVADDVAASVPDGTETPRAKKLKKDKSTVEVEDEDDPMGDEEPVNEFDYSAAAEIFEESKGADAVNGGKRKKKDKAKDKAAAACEFRVTVREAFVLTVVFSEDRAGQLQACTSTRGDEGGQHVTDVPLSSRLASHGYSFLWYHLPTFFA